jgi:tripeptidyl-peptidase-1
MLPFAVLGASAVASSRVALETDVSFGVTKHWRLVGAAAPSALVSVSVVLEAEKGALGYSQLEKEFWAVSDPKHARYGDHLTKAAVTSLVRAPAANLDATTSWLLGCGAVKTSKGAHDDMIEATLRAADAERCFGTRLYTYRHVLRGLTAIRVGAQGYSVPAHLATAIRLVEGLGRLPALSGPRTVVERQQTPTSGSWPSDCGTGLLGCGSKVTPAVLMQRYSLPPPPAGAQSFNGSTLAVAEFQGQVWDQKDLDRFAHTCSASIKWNVTVDHEAGRIAPGHVCQIPLFGTEACGESLLDIEYAKAVCGDIPLTDVYQGEYSLLKWANGVSAMDSPPLVHSVSYGNDEKQQSSTAYMLSCNQAFMKLGVRGLSILFASGDQGVCGRTGCGFGSQLRYHPDFPAASPYITAVGGTDFLTPGTIGDETAWPDGGGGFSDTFAIPDYQAAAVAAYKSSANATLPPQAYWNNTGRGYPDVSALAGEKNPYCISAGSMMIGIAGTSAASPVVAGIFARLNAVRLGKGGKPLGHLNPWIYQHADAFNDVTHGANGEGSKTIGGFAATKGWDPATGVGTPNFEKMVAAL